MTKVLDRFHRLMRKAVVNSSNSHHICMLNIDQRVEHARQSVVDDFVCVDNPPESKCRHEKTSTADDQLVNLRPRKFEPYRVV